jgi:hypothetical protein
MTRLSLSSADVTQLTTPDPGVVRSCEGGILPHVPVFQFSVDHDGLVEIAGGIRHGYFEFVES